MAETATSRAQELLSQQEQPEIPKATWDAAVLILKAHSSVTAALIQKKLSTSYATAVHILDRMKEQGLVDADGIVAINPEPPAPTQTAPASDQPASQGEKRTRTTVAKLLQRYQERESETDAAIAAQQNAIQMLQMDLDQLRSKKKFLRELIDDIESD